MPALEVRPGLRIEIQTVPGSAHIKWWHPDSPPVMFDPANSSFLPYTDTPPVAEILAGIAPADLKQIRLCLLIHAQQRSIGFAGKRIARRPRNPNYVKTVFEHIPDGKPREFWVITAYNPDGEDADAAANIEADKKLQAEFTKLSLKPFRIIGQSPDGHHAEPGWGIVCDETTAIRLGCHFRQEAIFQFKDGMILLVDCQSGEHVFLGKQTELVLDPRENRHYTLIVGSQPGKTVIDGKTREVVRSCLAKWFEGFTIQDSEGYFDGNNEQSIMIHVGTRRPRNVIALAQELRVVLQQTGIGLIHNGIYQRVREWSDSGLILESFRIRETRAGPRELPQ